MIGGEQGDFYAQMARQPIKTELPCRSTLADCDPRALGVGLLHPEGITAADLATPQHGGIDPNVGTVVLSCCAQDTRILREIALSEVVITQRAQGPVTLRRTASPIASIWAFKLLIIQVVLKGYIPAPLKSKTRRPPLWPPRSACLQNCLALVLGGGIACT